MTEETEFISSEHGLLKRLNRFIILDLGDRVKLDIREKDSLRTTPKTFMIIERNFAFRGENQSCSEGTNIWYAVWYKCVEIDNA